MAQLINEKPTMGVIRLGRWELPVVPQKHARLRRYISEDELRQVLSADYGPKSYRLLCIVVPAMDPNNPKAEDKFKIQEWEFDGFATEEAWNRYKEGDKDAYDEDSDPGPTSEEIAIAFETAVRVNGTGRLGKLMSLIQAGSKVAELEKEDRDLSFMLPGNSGESDSTNSGQNHQTPS